MTGKAGDTDDARDHLPRRDPARRRRGAHPGVPPPLPDPIEDVWEALTEPDRLARWYGSYQGVGAVGGTVLLTMTAEEDAGSEPMKVHIVECEPPQRLVVDLPETPDRTWRIAVTLSEQDGATVLLFEQPVPPEMDITSIGPGWHWYLDRLAASLASAPMPEWGDYYPALASVYH